MSFKWSKSITLGTKVVSDSSPSFIIAEIGINHEGSLSNCLQLIDAASEAGADAVKLQTILADLNYAPGTKSHSLFKSSELTPEETSHAFNYAKSLGLECFATCSDQPSIDLIASLNPCAWKISSGLITHIPLIKKLSLHGKPMLLSTGMAAIPEISIAVDAVRKCHNSDLIIFQCTSLYPCPLEDANLRSIPTIQSHFNCLMGFSDHCDGHLASILAVAMGSRIFEKHISLDPSQPDYDHQVSLDPIGLRNYVSSIRNAELCLGSSSKPIPDQLIRSRYSFLRLLAPNTDLGAGHILREQDIVACRAAKLTDSTRYFEPACIQSLTNRRLTSSIKAFTPFTEDHFYA